MMSKTAAEPLVRISKREGTTFVQKVLVRAIAILLALVVDAFFIFFVTGLNPISVYGVMWNGTFMNTTRFSWALRDLSSLLCIAIALAPAFKMRFWNIGAEGQVLAGGLAAAACMICLGDKLPNGLLIVLIVIAGIAAGAVMAMLCQGVSLHDILTVMYSGFSADTGSDVVNSMLNRGGFTSMLSTIGLLIAAGIFGAPLRTAGVVDVLLAFVERIAKTSRSMSLGVLILHAVFFTITGAYYVSYPVVGGMVKDLYPEYHLDRKNLMRTMLDTGTGLAPMVSWSTTGSYTTTTLGVSNLAFAPFAPMLWLSIVFSVIYAVTGIGTAKAKED